MRLLAITVLLALAGCAHVASTKSTFSHSARKPLVLTIHRHVDTIVRGPDSEEDQFLVLRLHDTTIGKRIVIPSSAVQAEFAAVRFGPESRGETYQGVIVLKSIGPKEVVAALSLNVTATTLDKSYKQTAKYRGDYTFARE